MNAASCLGMWFSTLQRILVCHVTFQADYFGSLISKHAREFTHTQSCLYTSCKYKDITTSDCRDRDTETPTESLTLK